MLPRKHHYLFSYRALLSEFFKHPTETIAILQIRGAKYLEQMWTVIAGNFPRSDALSPDGLGCQIKELPGAITLIIVTFPAPERFSEAYFAALVFRAGREFLIPRKGIKRYFTLERSLPSSGEPRTTICEWSFENDAQILRYNHGQGLAPTVAGFADGLSKILRDNSPLAWSTFPAGEWGSDNQSAPSSPTPQLCNMDRAERALKALRAYIGHERPDENEYIGDLLTDLMHFAHAAGLDFDTRFASAREKYTAEHAAEK
ncbi:MAG: hypothetical protein ABIP85_20640 [Chthoniobacteraceae bacterium]